MLIDIGHACFDIAESFDMRQDPQPHIEVNLMQGDLHAGLMKQGTASCSAKETSNSDTKHS